MPREMIWKKEDLREVDWVKEQTKSALSSLQKQVLYTEEWDDVRFDVETSLNYLQTLRDAKTWKEMVAENSWATIMAIQILLKNKWYDIGKIDGILRTKWQATSRTMETIKKFQRENWLSDDGVPGPDTLRKLLELYENWWGNGGGDVAEPGQLLESWWTWSTETITAEKYEELCGQKTLTEEDAKKIVDYANKNEMQNLELGLKDITQSVAEQLAQYLGKHFRLDWLTSIDKNTAKALAQYQGRGITLDWLTSIDKDVMAELSKVKVTWYFSLGWLTSIDRDTLEVLAQNQGRDILLFLDWLTSIDKEVAEVLVECKGNCYLNWLTSIDKEVAEVLAKGQGDLELNWLTSIDKEVAEALAKHQGECLYLNWLTGIDKEVAEALAKYQGDLELNWLTSIDKEVAEVLAKHQGEYLYIGWLESITDDVERELAKLESLRIDEEILTPEQKQILWK